MGIFMAPGMWPVANSDGERTSISWESAERLLRSATVMVVVRVPPVWEERGMEQKDSWPFDGCGNLGVWQGVEILGLRRSAVIFSRAGLSEVCCASDCGPFARKDARLGCRVA